MAVYIDTETTGLNTVSDALLEIAVVDDSGIPLLNTLIRPPELVTAWPAAQRVHRITPEMVAGAPTLAEIAPQVMAAVRDQDVVIYNAAFDAGFLGDLLAGARSVQCCMRAWAEHAGEWSDWHNDWRLHRLEAAAAAVCFTWPGEKHRALADAQACRAIWQYLRDEAERRRVDLQHRDRRLTREAEYALADIRYQTERRNDERNRRAGEFIAHWWQGLYGTRTHWSAGVPAREACELFAGLFFGKSLALLALEDRFATVYHSTKDVPAELHPASWFPAERWYQNELQACAAYVGKKQGWPLFHESEAGRIRALYPLRFEYPPLAPGETLMTKTALRKAGMSMKEIASLTPVAERQNGHSGEWYLLYKVGETV